MRKFGSSLVGICHPMLSPKLSCSTADEEAATRLFENHKRGRVVGIHEKKSEVTEL